MPRDLTANTGLHGEKQATDGLVKGNMKLGREEEVEE
jgi:hypothetical protein